MKPWRRGMPERALDPPEADEHCGDEDCDACNRRAREDAEAADDGYEPEYDGPMPECE